MGMSKGQRRKRKAFLARRRGEIKTIKEAEGIRPPGLHDIIDWKRLQARVLEGAADAGER